MKHENKVSEDEFNKVVDTVDTIATEDELDTFIDVTNDAMVLNEPFAS